MKKFWFILLAIFIVLAIVDTVKIFSYKVYSSLPGENIITYEDAIYADLVYGKDSINWEKLNPTLLFINNEYDTSDFKLVNLVRILYEYHDFIPEDVKVKIDAILLNFRYWMDEPGENSMCYWSENHQILFSSVEFLVGKFYSGRQFSRSKLSGREHQRKARKRILYWLEMRWLYGFTEFCSGVYYVENVAALLNLIDHSDDDEIVMKSKIILDLLFYDIATHSFQGMAVSGSGRAYESNRKGGNHENMRGITAYLLEGERLPPNEVFSLSNTKNYLIPPILRKIAKDSSNAVIRHSNGLDISELREENLFGTDDRSIMMQWGMEAFTNAPVIQNSMRYVRKNRMFSNEFLKNFRYLDLSVLSVFSLESFVSRLANPLTNGKAIQRGNTYVYRNENYSLYAVQNHHPGDYADQHHVAGMNIGNHFSIFHTHPARRNDDWIHSPNYWVGYGRLPHVAQDENVNMSIYAIPDKKGFMERYLLDYTHAYFPIEHFDLVKISGNYLFGMKGEVFCAVIGHNTFDFISSDNVIQPGKRTFWIIEGGSLTDDGSFEEFIGRVSANPLHFDEKNLFLIYSSKGKTYRLQFGNDLMINNEIIDFDYPRFDSPYIYAKRKPYNLLFEFDNRKLYLDFYNLKREFTD